MFGSNWSYEQGLGLEVLKSTAQTFIVEIEKDHVLKRLSVDPFGMELAHRMVQLIFALFPVVEEDVRLEFKRAEAEAANLETSRDGDLPF